MSIEMQYPLGIKNDPHIKFVAREYNFPTVDHKSGAYIKKGKILARGYFYIPAGLTQATSSSWNQEEMGVMGNIANGDYWRALKDVGVGLANRAAPGGVAHGTKVVGALGGKMVAPNDVLVLSSVSRYSMRLALQLAPQNAQEGKEVKKIINNFRRWSQPTLTTNKSKLWMHYPPVFDLLIRPKGSTMAAASSDTINENNNLFFYKDMIIESFDVQYQGGTNESLFYRDGTPILSTVTIGFKSLRPGYNLGGINMADKNDPDAKED